MISGSTKRRPLTMVSIINSFLRVIMFIDLSTYPTNTTLAIVVSYIFLLLCNIIYFNHSNTGRLIVYINSLYRLFHIQSSP